MSDARAPMRRVREILRLRFEAGMAVRDIVRRTGIPHWTVRTLFGRFAARVYVAAHTGSSRRLRAIF